MSYPPPPGLAGSPYPQASASPHPSLPARPPPSTSATGFKAAFAPTTNTPPKTYSPTTAPPYPATSSYAPGTVSAPAAKHYGPAYQSYAGAPTVNAAATAYQARPQTYQYPQANHSHQTSSYGPTPGAAAYSGAPQIRNPFPVPGSASDYDAEMAAQYAQWQSAYVSKDSTGRDPAAAAAAAAAASNTGRGGPGATSANAIPLANPAEAALPVTAEKPEKTLTVVREGGGKKWTDDTLLEWDPSHLRLFVGNLAGEVTDDSLLKAFSRWPSVQKARVIREKRTSKSKNYGFVSFSDPDDYFEAAKEMNGKYIQSHPVIVTRAKTEIKATTVKERDRGKKGKKGYHNKHGKQQQGFEPSLGPTPGAGVQKPGQRTKNGLKLLG